MEEQGKINKDTVTKFKAMDKILNNIDSKVTEVESLNHQVMNMMKMLETQVTQLDGHFTSNEGKLPGQSRNQESAKATQTPSRKKIEDPERSMGARKPKPASKVEMTSKEKTPTPAPEIEMKEPKSNINMPLLDALQVPTYACYFKDILMNKREISQFTTDHIKMTKECSATIVNPAAEKKRDSGCLTIPCSIGALMFERALCDLGASVSVMPKAVFEKLRLPKPNQLPCITEDVPMKTGNHFFSIDFLVLKMGEGAKSPLIQGRPFLKTAKANIDIGKGEIKFNINGTISAFKFRPSFEEEKNKKAEEKKPAEVAVIQKKEERQLVKTKKIAKPMPTLKLKMVKKWVPKTFDEPHGIPEAVPQPSRRATRSQSRYAEKMSIYGFTIKRKEEEERLNKIEGRLVANHDFDDDFL
ncbi:uncharacterized protein LOC101770300 [Setaria italica]|uniref:uncharacterized protein LOC101770300 n=1 Tax=Setaria italica TaxID=4555 RepID=UPI000350AD03|nr:uncharacterized protein LOC101770300 [Setaria italica]